MYGVLLALCGDLPLLVLHCFYTAIKIVQTAFYFLTGTFLGGAYEYLCSVLSEIVFGKVFWDYSKMPFNLNGRINLLYCFFWGIATVVWFKRIYPFLSNLIEKLPIAFGTVFTWIIVVFMVLNMFMSLSALIRYDQRNKKNTCF